MFLDIYPFSQKWLNTGSNGGERNMVTVLYVMERAENTRSNMLISELKTCKWVHAVTFNRSTLDSSLYAKLS